MKPVLRHVTLLHFRTYDSLRLALPPGLSVLHGANAAGKTNFLEALYLLSAGRSPRALRDEEMISLGASSLHVRAVIARVQAEAVLELSLTPEQGKEARLNGHPLPSLAQLAGLVPAVYFAPEEVALVSSGPARRRAFLDQLLCALQPSYRHHLERYRAVVAERNATLRDLRSRRGSDALLPVWDEQLVAHGAPLLSSRLQLVARLERCLKEECVRLGLGQEPALAYRPAGDVVPPQDPDEAAAWLERLLAAARPLERERGYTLVGPHRDDLGVLLAGLDARAFASQGQRRSLALALKMAAGRLLQAGLGVPPVLLLDDVLSELDAERRRSLLEVLADGRQVLLTCTDAASLKEMVGPKANFFLVRKGEIVPG